MVRVKSLTLLFALVLVACSPAATQAPAATETAPVSAEPRTLFIADVIDIAPIDPAQYSHTIGRTMIRAVYEPLVYYKLGEYTLEPRLAVSWDHSADGLSYTFKLRQGVKFHSGAPFTARDVKVTFDRVAAIGQNVAPASLGDSVKSVEVVDDSTVKFTLNFPYGYFAEVLPKIPIISAADVDAHQTDNDWAADWFSNNANGTGPYQLEKWDQGNSYTLLANTNWWGQLPDRAYERIVMRVIGDGAQQRQLLERGELHLTSDWIGGLDKINASKESAEVKLVDSKGLMELLLIINANKPPLDNKLVRQAMIAAFPYEKFMEYYQGYAELPTSVMANDYPGVDITLPPLKQDLDEARQLLSDAGFPDGGFTLEYDFDQGSEEKNQSALLFQDALAQIGVTLNINPVPGATWFDKGRNPETSAHFNPHYEAPETPDPFQWIQKMFGKDGYLNWTHINVPELDDTIFKAQHSLDPNERTALLKQAQHIIADEALAIPMSRFDILHAMSKCVEGYIFDVLDLQGVPKFWTLYQSPSCP